MINSKTTPCFISLALLSSLVACHDQVVQDGPEPAVETFRSSYAGDLMLHWTFEDRDGNQITDVSGNGRHGTLSGGSFVSSPWGEAVSLDGLDDKISLTGPRNPNDYGGATTGALTISAHVRVEDVDSFNLLCIGCAPISHMSIGSSNVGPRVVGALHDPTASPPNYKTFPHSNAELVDDTWVHVTMVVEAGVGTKFYLDCEFDREVENENIELKDYNYSSVGEGVSSGTWFEGEIDDLKVWSRALSAAEIKDLCPCGGAPEAYDLGIEPPTPPLPYDPPAADPPNVVEVEPGGGSNGLQAMVTAGVETIVLDDGVYTAEELSGDYLSIRGQQLWAKNVGGAILEFGIYAGGDDDEEEEAQCTLEEECAFVGSELHGLVFDIQDEENAPVDGSSVSAAIMGWDHSTDFVIEDCVIHGGPVDAGIWMLSPEGFEARRLEIDHVNSYGIVVGGSGVVSSPVTLTDIRVWDVDNPAVVWKNAGLWVSQTANMSRIHVRDVRWAGIVINGNSNGSTASNLDIDRIGTTEETGRVGVYLDNTAREVTVSHFCVGPDTFNGVRSEWDNNKYCLPGVDVFGPEDVASCVANHPGPAVPFPRGIDNVVEYGLIESWYFGVGFDQGTVNGDVNHVTFRNYNYAAILFYKNMSTEEDWPFYDDGGSQSDNTFEECEVCGLTLQHPCNLMPPNTECELVPVLSPPCEDSPPSCP